MKRCVSILFLVLVLVGCDEGRSASNVSADGSDEADGGSIYRRTPIRSDLDAIALNDGETLGPNDAGDEAAICVLDGGAWDVVAIGGLPEADVDSEVRAADAGRETTEQDTRSPDAVLIVATDAGLEVAQPITCPAPTYLGDQAKYSTVFRDGASVGLLGQATPVWGEKDLVTGPACLPGDYVAGADRSCSQYLSWGAGRALCLSGAVPAVPAAELGTSWGLGIKVPAGCAGELGQDFASVTFSLSGAPAAAVKAGRLQLALAVRGTDGASTLYYAPDDGIGAAHDLAKFNTEWWAPADGTYLKPSQVRHITAAYVIVVSSSTESYTVNDLCLSQVDFK